MAETIAITAQLRDRAGKGAARAARRDGMIPGVIYGAKEPPVLINVDGRSLVKLLRDPAFASHLYDVAVDGGKQHVLARDVQLDPVTDRPLHIDFLRVSDRTTIAIDIPVQFINDEASPGIKRGGVLNVVRHTIELVCRADSIPEHLTVDLTGLEVGDSVHISAIALPAGVRPTITDRDFTVATIAAPTVAREEEAEEAEAAEEGTEAEADETDDKE
ncbi:MAG: 50S ribosomal protein L25/general stress protein Ctc [Inquilinaceae bacterium]